MECFWAYLGTTQSRSSNIYIITLWCLRKESRNWWQKWHNCEENN